MNRKPNDYSTSDVWIVTRNARTEVTSVTMRDGMTFVPNKNGKLIPGVMPEPALKFYDPHPCKYERKKHGK